MPGTARWIREGKGKNLTTEVTEEHRGNHYFSSTRGIFDSYEKSEAPPCRRMRDKGGAPGLG